MNNSTAKKLKRRYEKLGVVNRISWKRYKRLFLKSNWIDRTKIFAWVLNGFLVALGSIILTSRVGSGEPWMGGFNMLLESLAATVIGGTSLFGGKGGMGGTLVGVLIIVFLVNGLTLMGMNQFVREIIIGLLIIIAVWFGFRGR